MQERTTTHREIKKKARKAGESEELHGVESNVALWPPVRSFQHLVLVPSVTTKGTSRHYCYENPRYYYMIRLGYRGNRIDMRLIVLEITPHLQRENHSWMSRNPMR